MKCNLSTLFMGLMLHLGMVSGVAAADARVIDTPLPVVVAAPQIAPEPIWQSEFLFDQLLKALEGLRLHGLDPADYHLMALKDMRSRPERREELATQAWLHAAQHLTYGRMHMSERDADWRAGERFVDLQEHLHQAAAKGSVADSLDRLAPQNEEYRTLMAELAALHSTSQSSVIPIPEGPLLRKGDSGLRVRLLWVRLAQLGYLLPNLPSDTFDDEIAEAVEMLQWDAGLEPDGIVGPQTRDVLNLTAAAKIDRLRINLERLRWLPGDLGERHVRVNIAGFDVNAYEDGVRVQTHRAIVGRLERQTPVFSDHIRYVVFNPWWETPISIARRDELPLFRRDPDAVRRLGFQVLDRSTGERVDPSTIDWHEVSARFFPYRLRQAPGPLNALGQVKIMFPNRHNVYLHDTPKRQLFDRSQRTFSSGCIRVQDVLDLVRWLLDDPESWGPEQIQAVVNRGNERVVRLPRKVPVHILYLTAVSTPDGMVRYLPDLYRRDDAVLAALETPLPIAQAEY